MRPGQVVADRFVVELVAGRGGMGTIYRATDRLDGAAVAVKVLAGDGDSERFMREGKVLAQLSHPSIVRYVAHGISDAGDAWLAMEWLDGQDLAARLGDGPLSAASTVQLAIGVAEALATAHGHGVVHRDIKPSNIFLVGGDPARAKLLDFGVARVDGKAAYASGRRGTATGAFLGTPGYVSPEQARGDRHIGPSADLFGLGCVLFECLTGQPVFAAEHVLAVLAKILLVEPQRPGELVPVAAALDELVVQMLAKHPSGRPSDAAAVVAALRALGTVDDAPRSPSATDPALTTHERRLFSVVMAGGRGAPGITQRLGAGDTDAPMTLDKLVEAHGGQLTELATGVLVTVSGGGAATDQAARAARCALALHQRWPDAPIALATGRRDPRSPLPASEVIDRVGAALARGPHDRVVVDDVTAGLLDGRFEVRGDDRGLWLDRERRGDGPRTLLGRPAPFVGRERELATLRSFWEECVVEPVARAVLVTSAAGAGKSRLRYELVSSLERTDDPPLIVTGRCEAVRAGSPYGPLVGALRFCFGIADTDPPSLQRRRVRARLADLGARRAGRVAAFLGELMAVPNQNDDDDPQVHAARHDALLHADQVRLAFVDWLALECTRQPVVLVLEDLHWGDLPTVTLIDAALRALRDRPLLVLAFARPEIHELFPQIWEHREVQEVRLGELGRRACERMVRGMLGPELSDAAVESIVTRAAGNPFYLEEYIRAQAEGRHDELPGTILAMVEARLEALEPAARRVLRAASVFGQVFWTEGVRRLLGEADAAGLASWLDELVRREVLVTRSITSIPAQPGHAFRHALVREAAYNMLTPDDLVLGHRLAGAWLAAAGAADPMQLAEHFERGGEPALAIGELRRAAELALEAGDLPAVLARVQRAVAAGATGPELGALAAVAAPAHNWRGEHAAAEARALEALECLAHRTPAWHRTVGELAIAAGQLGHTDVLATWADRLLADAPSGQSDAGDYLTALARLAWQLVLSGRGLEVDAIIARLGALEQRVADRPAVLGAIAMARGFQASMAGDPVQTLDGMRQAVSHFERVGNLREVCLHRANYGYCLAELGQYEQAAEECRQALSEAQRLDLDNPAALAQHNLGYALAMLGQVEAARHAERAAIAAFGAHEHIRMLGVCHIYLAIIALVAGDPDEAVAEASEAARVLAELRPTLAHALAVRARAYLELRRTTEALADAEAAMALLERLSGVDDGESMIRLVHAQALAATGDLGRAQAALGRAREHLLARAGRIEDLRLRADFLGKVAVNRETLAAGWPTPHPT